jgi:hypothetical protein
LAAFEIDDGPWLAPFRLGTGQIKREKAGI